MGSTYNSFTEEDESIYLDYIEYSALNYVKINRTV